MRRSSLIKALRIVGACALLAATLACTFTTSGDDPPQTNTSPTPAPAPAPAPAPSPQPEVAANPAPAPGPGTEPAPSPAPSPAPDPGVAPPNAPSSVQLSTGFMPDPHTARGQAGGSVEASSLASEEDDCRGWVPAAPQHTLTLQTAFSNLRILVSAPEDTTLVVRGPDGRHYCADDDEELNPIVSGSFAAGTYQVFVGTYNQGATPAYVIGFSELDFVTASSLGN